MPQKIRGGEVDNAPYDFFSKLPVRDDESEWAGPGKVYTNADLEPKRPARKSLEQEVIDATVDGDTLPPVETGPSADELVARAKQALAGIEASDLGKTYARINGDVSAAHGQMRAEQQQLGEERTVAGNEALAMAAAGAGVLMPWSTIPAGARALGTVAMQPGPIGAAIGGYEGYKRDGFLGALGGGLEGYAGGAALGSLGKLAKAATGLGGEAGALASAAKGAGSVAAAEAPAAEAAVAKTVPKMFRSAESGAYEAERLYNDAIGKGYSESMARKLAGMPDRTIIYNAEKASAFPPNVKFPGKTAEDSLERAMAGMNPKDVTVSQWSGDAAAGPEFQAMSEAPVQSRAMRVDPSFNSGNGRPKARYTPEEIRRIDEELLKLENSRKAARPKGR